ncbi:hypothetical protein WSK_1972 [Novosphingobium sp. Rr 2-17]|nr:hypothetical protein WSK_1972 [Novosphingobium sp. Rr 2-17]
MLLSREDVLDGRADRRPFGIGACDALGHRLAVWLSLVNMHLARKASIFFER